MKQALPFFRGFLIVIVAWQLFSWAAGARILPPPFAVFVRFFELLPGVLLPHSAASFGRVLLSLVCAAVPAVPLGLILGRRPELDSLFTPAVYLLYPVPKIALLPVVMLLFGMGNVSKVLIVSLVLFFQIVVTVRDAAKSVEPEYIVSAGSLGAGPVLTFLYVIIPAVLPSLFTALKVGTGTALAVLFFAETFFTQYGLGYFIVDAWMRIRYVEMFAGILALSFLGFLLFRLIDLLERIAVPWKQTGPR